MRTVRPAGVIPRTLSAMTTTPRRIAVLTTSRADFGHLYWPLRCMREDPRLEPKLVVCGAHLAPEFGCTVTEIEALGFSADERVECLLSSDTDVGMAKTIGVAVLGLTDALARLRPELLLLIADRYEMLAPAAAALALRLPVAHIEGGEVSEGAIDDAVRNALTKMSHLHLAPTEQARRRILAMGEESWRVHRVGAPSLDHLRHGELLDRTALEAQIGASLGLAPCVVSYHPVTMMRDTLGEADALFAALAQIEGQIVFCFPNADAGSRRLVERARRFCHQRGDALLLVNLAPRSFWSLLALAGLLLGNSSSGIMEAPSLALPTVNIGIRQRGRERAANVIDAPADAAAIVAAAERAASPRFRASLAGMANPYGDGRAGERIAQILAEAPPAATLLDKRALPVVDIDGRFAFSARD